MQGEMGYMGRADRSARTLDPAIGVPGARSLVVVGANYFAGDLPAAWANDPSRGVMASYAWSADYHDVMTPRLEELGRWLTAEVASARFRAYVDTGPVLERDAAERAGMGFFGRNTMLIRPGLGSWLFLGALITDLELAYDAPFEGGTCGRCTRCLTACPTEAFPRPYVLDSRRCISYLTIELTGPIPIALRSGIGNRIFGCDICNEACPYNRSSSRNAGWGEPLDPEIVAPHLLDLVGLDESGFQVRFARSPVKRTRRRGLLRNVCVALGNWGAPEAVPALRTALTDDEPLVRSHAAWALGRIGTDAAITALRSALGAELDDSVQLEVISALGDLPMKDRRSRSTSPAGEDGNMAGRSPGR
jgi:epoxyqueuosine reductase